MNMFTVLELRRRSRSRMTTAAVALAITTLLAACGGGGGGGGVSDGGTVATAPAAAATSATATAAPGVGEGTAIATAAPGTAGDSGNAAASTTPTATPLVLRARGTLAGGIGPIVQVRVAGQVVASIEVKASTFTDYSFNVPRVAPGTTVDVVFTNNAFVGSEDRNLIIAYLQSGDTVVMPFAPGAVYDRGTGAAAFDGLDTVPGVPEMTVDGALRVLWPIARNTPVLASQTAASRFLQQATFGGTTDQINRVVTLGAPGWISEQMALPPKADFVDLVQAKYDQGPEFRPHGAKYDPSWVAQRFWATAATAPDQLRKRVAFSLHQMFVVSQADSNQWLHARAYANYLDTLNSNAFGNFRTLLEEMALSPSMGIYLSHIRNRKEDPATGRLPDENFAREIMQLFTIGLHELNLDGSLKLDANGKPIETYTNADVMALAKVFTGWSWAFPDNQLTESNFRAGAPNYSVAADQRIDLLKMKAYPGQSSTAEKTLFAGKPQAVVIPANASAADSLRIALDTLFKHPNVGPFVSRQLIQRLVTSAPSPAYVARVATLFNNNGSSVRGDMAAVVRAVLLDAEARTATVPASFGKLRDPVLRVTQWMRAFSPISVSGSYLMVWSLDTLTQNALYAPSVFSYSRPGYVPANTPFMTRGATAPEFQIVNESTTASWVNTAEAMAGHGLGWTGTVQDVSSQYNALAAMAAAGDTTGMLDQLNLLLFAGRMSAELRSNLLDAVGGVGGNTNASHLNRARVAVFIALASPEYIAQR